MPNRKVGPSFTPHELATLYRIAGALWVTLDISVPAVRATLMRRQEDAAILRDLFVGATHRLGSSELAGRVQQMAPPHIDRILGLE